MSTGSGEGKRPVLVVSACLTGRPCRYDGRSNRIETFAELERQGLCVAVCPETLGGLSTPRVPCERRGDRVIDRDGVDRTENFRRGAIEALALAGQDIPGFAVLKARSPSCGAGRIYDGTFSRTLTAGSGFFAELLLAKGWQVRTEENCADLLRLLFGPDVC